MTLRIIIIYHEERSSISGSMQRVVIEVNEPGRCDNDIFELMRSKRYFYRMESLTGGQLYRLSDHYGEGSILRKHVGEGIVYYATTYERASYKMSDKLLLSRSTFELILVMEGTCHMRVLPSEEWQEFAKGDLILFQSTPEISIIETRATRFSSISLELDLTIPDLHDEWKEPLQRHLSSCLNGGYMTVLKAPERVISMFRQIATMTGLEKADRYFQWKGLSYLIFSECLEWAARSGGQAKSRIVLTEADQLALLHIRDQLASEPDQVPTLAELSRQCCMNTTKLKQGFKQLFQTSISSYMLELKVAEGKRQLQETSKSITHIALELGYSNPSKFSALFKKMEGMTPREWRRRYDRN